MYKLFSQTIFMDRDERDSLYAVFYDEATAIKVAKYLSETASADEFFWLEDENFNVVGGERKYYRCVLCDRVRKSEELDSYGTCDLGCYVT